MIRRCALATLSYDNMVPEPKFGTNSVLMSCSGKIRKCKAGPTRTGLRRNRLVNSRKSRALIAQANSYNLLCKIGDGENVSVPVKAIKPRLLVLFIY